MNRTVVWVVAVAAGIVALLVATAAIGSRDDEVVSAGEWAQNVCGAVGVWRGELEAIVEDVRTPTAFGNGQEEPQSETPQGRTGLVREGLQRSVQATETLVEGVDRAGTPDTEDGEEAAERVSQWADDALEELEEAEDALDDEAESLEQALEQLGGAARQIAATLASGTQTIAEVSRLDPELRAALRESSTCRELPEEATAE